MVKNNKTNILLLKRDTKTRKHITIAQKIDDDVDF